MAGERPFARERRRSRGPSGPSWPGKRPRASVGRPTFHSVPIDTIVAPRTATASPDEPAQDREQGRLGQELDEDVPRPRAHGHAQADLDGPLLHGQEHERQDARASDEQGHTRKTRSEEGE